MKTLIVNATSKSKMEGGETRFFKERGTMIDHLSSDAADTLLQLRKKVLEFIVEPEGPDIHPSFKNPGIQLLPAFRRYTGRTYSQIATKAWEAIQENEKIDMVIVSPFYGIILYDDPIRNYDVKSVDKTPEGKTFKTFWKSSNLSGILEQFVLQNNFDQVLFVLSETYSTMVEREKLSQRLEEKGISCSYHQFKEFGRGSMLERGRFITKIAQELRDQN